MSDRWEQTGAGAALAASSVASVQFGAAIAVTLFPVAGPLGVVALRSVGAAVVLGALTRPWRRSWSPEDLRRAFLLGAVLVAMNSCLYLAIDRLPLATGITLELLGPLGLAIFTAGSWRRRLWALPAAIGVVLLGGSLTLSDLPGVICALAAAGGWAVYIILNTRMGSTAGLRGLGMATVAAAVVAVPIGVATSGAVLVRPTVLAEGLAVGVLSAALPYSLDLLALRRLPTPVFGVLTSLNPAVAAVAGAVVIGDRLAPLALLGIAAVVIASAGAVVSRSEPGPVRSRRRAPAGRCPAPAGAGPAPTRGQPGTSLGRRRAGGQGRRRG